ncbi:MAG: B12-binding domain-containing radical SAM protein [Actinobacteria bacterium]|nr:B12-binding domain-containing radical SAM protein [Actinomycetota bacterium]
MRTALKVTFVYPDFFQYDEERYLPEGRIYLGIGYLSAYLRREGHETSLIHLVRPASREELLARVREEAPDVLAFSSTTHMFPHVRKWVAWVKDDMDIFTICGGAHTTLDPAGALEEAPLDAVCLGEGEEALAELCAALEEGRDHSGIASLWVRVGDTVRRNPVRPLIEDLDSLPFPDRDIFDPSCFCPQQHERGTLMASRGCPYSCTYCSNHAQRSIYPNRRRYVRFRSVDSVMREIHGIIAADREGRLRYIRFDDDILTLHPEWFRELASRYRREVDLPFICNSRVNVLDEETVRAFAEAGCSVICMGIESGNEELRRRVLGRRMSNEEIVRAFRLCRKYGIKTVSTNMTCLPDEDLPALLDTVKLNAKARPHCLQVSTYHPYPNTRLYAYCEERGYLSGRHVDTIFDGRSALDIPAFSEPAFAFAREKFYPLAELYSRLFERGLPGEAAARVVDTLFTLRRVPWRWRRPLLARMVDWADRRSRFEWIYY